MHDKSHSFDPQFPYKLSDDDYNRLVQVHGMLTLLTDLTGYAKPDRSSIDCQSLHTALWGLQDAMDTVVVGFEKQNANGLARLQAANSQISQSTHQPA